METTATTVPPPTTHPITARTAIARLRRDLALGWFLKVTIAVVLIVAIIGGDETTQTAAFFAVGIAWVALAMGSRRGSQLAAGSSSLIAAGLHEAAEVQLSHAIGKFSLFRSAKLLSIHHLALLRHTQQRFDESAQLSRALLGHRLGPLRALTKSARLMLASASVHLNDLPAAYTAISQLYAQRLSLGEALHLLRTQLDYESRIGAWTHMANGLPVKVQLAELMPTQDAAAVQALLALAARKTGQKEWEEWLCQRVGMLTDVGELTTRMPLLRELWA